MLLIHGIISYYLVALYVSCFAIMEPSLRCNALDGKALG